MSEPKLLYEGEFIGINTHGRFSTIWTAFVKKYDGTIEKIDGDWRPIKELYESVKIGTRVKVLQHPNYYLPVIEVIESE